MNALIKIILPLTILFSSASTFAGPAANKEKWKNIKTAFETSEGKMKKACGFDIKMTANEASFGDTEEIIDTAFWCMQVSEAVENLCAEAKWKPAIKERIKTINCEYKKELSREKDNGVQFEFKKGNLMSFYNKDSSNIQTFAVYEWLPKNL
jgi:hypothetical protein